MNIIPFFAAISGNAILLAIVQIFVAAIIYWLVNWYIGYAKIGEPFDKLIRVLLGLFVLIVLINAVLTVFGRPFINF